MRTIMSCNFKAIQSYLPQGRTLSPMMTSARGHPICDGVNLDHTRIIFYTVRLRHEDSLQLRMYEFGGRSNLTVHMVSNHRTEFGIVLLVNARPSV